jgi:hypothetical protein
MNEVPLREEETANALEEAIGSRNYLYAETLARRLNRPEAEVRGLREEAFRQQVVEFRNPQGAVVLVEEFGFSREDTSRLLKAALEETVRAEEKDKGAHTAKFDMESMGYLSLEEWIKRYFKP